MDKIIAVETTEGDITAPSDDLEIVNSWTEEGINE